MEKLYKKIGWKNKPNLATPLGATNLKKIDEAIDGLDNRTIELDSKDAEQGRHIEELYAETRNNAQAIEEVRESTQYIDSSKIVTNKSGAPVYIDDASNMNIENIVLYGESKQKTTTGKNLLKFPYYGTTNKVTEGVTFTTNSDGIITINGTSTGDAYLDLYLSSDKLLTNNPFIFSKGVASNIDLFYCERINGAWSSSTSLPETELKITPSTNATGQIFRVSLPSGRTANNVKVYPMVRLASNTDSTWEKYTGEKPAPNPDYPQPIESKIVNRVDVLGKNFLKFSQGSTTINGITFTVNADKSVTVNGTATADAVLLLTTSTRGEVDLKRLTGKNIILSGCPNGGSSSTYRFQFWSDSKMAVDTGNGATLDLSTVPDTWNFAISIISGTKVNNLTFYPMIRLASVTDATYEPYQSHTVNLSTPIELNGIGGVRDTDKVKNIYVKVFTGNESFRTYTPGVGGIQFGCEDENISQIESDNVLCTHLPPKFTWNVREDGIAITSSNSVVVRFRMESLGISTIEDLKAKLKEWYDAGNPMVLYAPIKTPIETELPQADIDAIKNLHTYKPNTVVMNDADAEMDVQYVADTKAYIDNKFRELATVIVNQ